MSFKNTVAGIAEYHCLSDKQSQIVRGWLVDLLVQSFKIQKGNLTCIKEQGKMSSFRFIQLFISYYYSNDQLQRKSKFVAFRMSIPQILSYREQHKIKALQQQILSLKTSVQLKNKQIYFLSTQIVSLKQQHCQKTGMLEQQTSQDKKQIYELRRRVTKMNSISSELVEKQMIEMKRSYQMKLQNQKENYESIISGLKRKFQQEIEMFGQKYESKLVIQRKQVQGLKQIIEQNNKNNIGSVQAFSQQSKLLSLDKKQLQQQLQIYKDLLQKAKRQLDKYIQDHSQGTKKMEVQLLSARAMVEAYAQNNKQLQKSLQFTQNQFKMSQIELHAEIKKLKHQNLQYQAIILSKDQEFTKPFEIQPRKVSPQKLTINQVRDCSHQGLIQELERNIGLLTRENAYLRKKIKDWGQQIGFQSSLSERFEDVNRLSEKVVSSHNNFRSFLQNRTGKISKNKIKK